jgi:hypothetical protein
LCRALNRFAGSARVVRVADRYVGVQSTPEGVVMVYSKPSVTDYGDLTTLTAALPPGGPEDCGGKHGEAAGHTAPPGPACPSPNG